MNNMAMKAKETSMSEKKEKKIEFLGAPEQVAVKGFDTAEERDEHMRKVEAGETELTPEEGKSIQAVKDDDEHFAQIGVQMLLSSINTGHITPMSGLVVMCQKMKADDELPSWVREIIEVVHKVAMERLKVSLEEETRKTEAGDMESLAKRLLSKTPEGVAH